MNRIEATKKAKISGKRVDFNEFTENGILEFSGRAHPCGCLVFDTVLSDGTIGWGEWEEQCPECFHRANS